MVLQEFDLIKETC